MMSTECIRSMSDEAAKEAAEQGLRVYAAITEVGQFQLYVTVYWKEDQ